jgi:hypothetical protein
MSLPPMSQRIVEFAGDDLPSPDNVDTYLEVLKFAQMAWNYSVVSPDSEAAKIVERGILKMPPLIRTSVYSRLIEWVERKRKMFPEDRRIIAKLRVKDSKRRLTVEAATYDYDKPRKTA